MRMLALFEKGERLRHIGHLDLMRAMQRALRRSGLPVAYSKGYNPHVLLTFASALSTGAWGKRELMDVALEEDALPDAFVSSLRSALPKDLPVLSARVLDDKHPALMAMVAGASYTLTVTEKDAAERLCECRKNFLMQSEIHAMRKTKSGLKDCDIRSLIFSLDAAHQTISASLALTEIAACKPEMLVSAWSRFAGCETPHTLICREGLLGRNESGILQPLEQL